jgi:hypothetical protein
MDFQGNSTYSLDLTVTERGGTTSPLASTTPGDEPGDGGGSACCCVACITCTNETNG